MQRLEALVREAQATVEVQRVLQICNACRYCEGYCAVFPAMARRLEFTPADVHYLANLCHNCGACLHACQYAAPHEFAVNVPRAMAKVRVLTYRDYAWPHALGTLYRRNGLVVVLVLAASLSLFLLLITPPANPGHSFYGVLSHGAMVALFGGVFIFAMLALGVGVARFWRGISPSAPPRPPAIGEALRDALLLTNLGGGHGLGCNDEDDRFTLRRRRFHHLTFYGFMLCFAATSVATIYHYALGLDAPYAILSLPVLLGTAGGIGLLVGPLGLLWLQFRRDPAQGDPEQRGMDRAFIALLLLASSTGLILLVLRESRAMPALLAVHLGVILTLFLTLPYGKFAHGIYRCAALLKSAIERRQVRSPVPGAD
jgi:citrate/tricarballylate utilization protein